MRFTAPVREELIQARLNFAEQADAEAHDLDRGPNVYAVDRLAKLNEKIAALDLILSQGF